MVAQVLPRKVWPIALILACVGVEGSLLRVGIDDLDEGYFIQQAARLLNGQLPYRDFETLYSPGLTYLHAAIFAALGGPSLVAPRALALLARAGLALLLFALARPHVRRDLWAAMPGVALFVGLDQAPVRWEPHPGWLSVLFAVIAVWSLSRPPTTHWLIAGGAFAALAYVFKQNTGVLVLAAILVWSRRFRPWLPLTGFAALTLVWLAPLAVAVGDLRPLLVLIGYVSQSGLFSAPDVTNLVPLACMLGGIWLLRRDSDPRLRWYLLAGTALYLTEFPRMDTPHLVWSAPVLLMLGAIALDRLHPLAATAFVAAALVLLAPTVMSRVDFLAEPRAAVDAVEAPVNTANEIRDVVADVEQRTSPGEPMFVYPTSPLLYALAGRQNATRWDHLNPGAANTDQIVRIIADLSRVKLVVISDYWMSAWGTPGANRALETWLSEHFHEVARHGAYRVLTADL